MTTRYVFPVEWSGLLSEPDVARPGNIISLIAETKHTGPMCDNCWSEEKLMLGFRVAHHGAPRMAIKWFGNVKLFGNLITLPCPVCAGDARQRFLEDNSGLVGMLIGRSSALDIRLEHFEPLDGKEYARQLAGEVLHDLTDSKAISSFCVTGPYGTGKTMLLVALVNGARMANIRSKYTTAEGMLHDIRETFNHDTRKRITEDVIQEYSHYPVLAIDELDRANFESRWVATQYFDIVNRRLSSRTLTLFASNQGLPELAQGIEPLPAIASRLSAGLTCEIAGSDLRPMLGARLMNSIESI